MKHRILFCVLTCGLFSPTIAMGYEITTHGLITDHAYRISVLSPANPNSIVPTLGFDRLDADYPFSFNGGPASTAYCDEAALSNPASNFPTVCYYQRYPQLQESNVLEELVTHGFVPGESGLAAEERVRSWLVRGAVREDDNDGIAPVLGWKTLDHRDPDPFGFATRATIDPAK